MSARVGRTFSRPPVLPPVPDLPQLGHDILDSLQLEFPHLRLASPTTSHKLRTPPVFRIHAPKPFRLMNSTLVPPPPSALADVPQNHSDVEDVEEMPDGDITEPRTPTGPCTTHSTRLAAPSPPPEDDQSSFKGTPPLKIRKRKKKKTARNGIPTHHRRTMPDCPRTPTPELRSVQPVHPALRAIVDGNMMEAPLPPEILAEVVGGAALTTLAHMTTMGANPPSADLTLDDPFMSPPKSLSAKQRPSVAPTVPPAFALGELPPTPDGTRGYTGRRTPSPYCRPDQPPSPYTHAGESPRPASPPRCASTNEVVSPPTPPLPRRASEADADEHPTHRMVDADIMEAYRKRSPPRQRPQYHRMVDADIISLYKKDHPPIIAGSVPHVPPIPVGLQGLPSAQLQGGREWPPHAFAPARPAAPVDMGDMSRFDVPLDTSPDKPLPKVAKSRGRTNSSSGSHNRRPSEEGTISSLREVLAGGGKLLASKVKRRSQDRTSVGLYSPTHDPETWSQLQAEFAAPPPTTNAKAVALLGAHDRRHDRRGIEDQSVIIHPPPAPFPGATSKAAALLGIGAPEPEKPKRGRWFRGASNQPRNPPPYTFARKTKATGSSYKLQTRRPGDDEDSDDDLDDDLPPMGLGYLPEEDHDSDLDNDNALDSGPASDDASAVLSLHDSPPRPVNPIPVEEDVTITPGHGQSFSPVDTKMMVHGPTRDQSPPRDMHPFATVRDMPPRTPIERTASEKYREKYLVAKLSAECARSARAAHTGPKTSAHVPPASATLPAYPSGSAKASHAPQGRSNRPPPIDVDSLSATRFFPAMVQTPNDNPAFPNTSASTSTIRAGAGAVEGGRVHRRIRSHVLARHRLIDPPIEVYPEASYSRESTVSRDSTCTSSSYTTTSSTSTTSTTSTGTYSSSSSTSRGSEYSGTAHGSSRGSYDTIRGPQRGGSRQEYGQSSSGHGVGQSTGNNSRPGPSQRTHSAHAAHPSTSQSPQAHAGGAQTSSRLRRQGSNASFSSTGSGYAEATVRVHPNPNAHASGPRLERQLPAASQTYAAHSYNTYQSLSPTSPSPAPKGSLSSVTDATRALGALSRAAGTLGASPVGPNPYNIDPCMSLPPNYRHPSTVTRPNAAPATQPYVGSSPTAGHNREPSSLSTPIKGNRQPTSSPSNSSLNSAAVSANLHREPSNGSAGASLRRYPSNVSTTASPPQAMVTPPRPRQHLDPQPHSTPWRNYNIRYDKDGRDIPNLTPRRDEGHSYSTAGLSSAGYGGGDGGGREALDVEEVSSFEPLTPSRPLARGGTIGRLQGRWIKK